MGRKKSATTELNVAEKQADILASRLSGVITDSKEIAEYLGCSQQAINQYKTGISRPSLDNLRKISEFYRVPVDYLLGLPWGTKSLNGDVRNAVDYTGLSEEAIERLHSCTDISSNAGKDILSKVIELVWIGYLGQNLRRASGIVKDHINSLKASGRINPDSPNYGTYNVTAPTIDGRILLSERESVCYTSTQIREVLYDAVDRTLKFYYDNLFKKMDDAEGESSNAVNPEDGD